jgi:hypothetical protein
VILWENGFTIPGITNFPLLIRSVSDHQNYICGRPLQLGEPFENPFVRRVKGRIDVRFKLRTSKTRNSHHAIQQTSNELILFRHQVAVPIQNRLRL